MKKSLRSVLSIVMMIALLAALAVPAMATGTEYAAKLGYANSDWSVQEWGDNANVAVTGDGSYTLTWNVPEGSSVNDALVFVIDIVGAQADLDAAGKTYSVTELTIQADGNDVPVDLSKVVTGDLEDNGNFRIEIYNEYGSTKENPPVDPAAMVFSGTLTINFTLATIDQPVEDAAAAGAAGEWPAFLMFSDRDWAFGNWDAALANTTVTGAGTYTVTLNATDVGGDGTTGANGAMVFCVDITGANASLTAEGKTFQLTDLKVYADGNEVAVDFAKLATGDIEENGNFRIEIYNEYGLTPADPAIDFEGLTFAQTLSVEFTLDVVNADGSAVEEEVTEPAVAGIDLDGAYNAYLGIQTPNWTYRDPWNSPNGIGSDYWGSFIYGNETSEKYGVVTDTAISGNGTYTVSLTDFGTIISDDFTAAGQDYFNLLFISTDIPYCEEITFTDVKLIIDGKTVHTYKEAYLDPDSTDYFKILIQNIWNEDVAEISYYAAPTASVEMQFTVSGFNYDNAEQSEAEPTAAPTEAPAVEEPAAEGGSNAIIWIVAIVVVVAAAVVIFLKKKKQ